MSVNQRYVGGSFNEFSNEDVDLDSLGEAALGKAGELSPEELDFITLGPFREDIEELVEDDDDEI